jgi:hypothetical protein
MLLLIKNRPGLKSRAVLPYIGRGLLAVAYKTSIHDRKNSLVSVAQS